MNYTDPETGQQVQYFPTRLFTLMRPTGKEQEKIAPLGRLLLEDGAQLADIPMMGQPAAVCIRFFGMLRVSAIL
jgi:hypothetical protein